MSTETSFAGTFSPDREHVRAGGPRAEGVGLIELSPQGVLVQTRFYASSNPLAVGGTASAIFLLCVPLMMVVRHANIVVWPMLAIVGAGALYGGVIDRLGRDVLWHVPWERVEILDGPGQQIVLRVRKTIVSEAGLPAFIWFRPVVGKPRFLAAVGSMRGRLTA
jgi:hypothetical protein